MIMDPSWHLLLRQSSNVETHAHSQAPCPTPYHKHSGCTATPFSTAIQINLRRACRMVSKLNCEPFQSVNSPACVPVRQRRPSGVHTATLMLQRICAAKIKLVCGMSDPSRRVLCV